VALNIKRIFFSTTFSWKNRPPNYIPLLLLFLTTPTSSYIYYFIIEFNILLYETYELIKNNTFNRLNTLLLTNVLIKYKKLKRVIYIIDKIYQSVNKLRK
jgi:hypothetical protein